MTYSDDFGKAVTMDEAHAYVENYKAFLDTLIAEILPLVPPDAPEAVQKCVAFYKSKSNAFVFDSALLKPFFEEPDPAPYIVVYSGATSIHPTIVLAGLEKDSDPNKLAVVFKVPPKEQPPWYVYAEFPDKIKLDIRDLQPHKP